MALRRGFKSEAERIVRRVQTEIGLSAADPIPPERVAELLGIEVIAGDELLPRQRFVELHNIQPDAFSACTLRPSPDRVVIVHNPLSSESRQNSDVAHELAHTLLDHELSRVQRLGDVTFLSCDPIQEEEAAWLSGCLLLPRALLLAEVRRGAEVKVIAQKHGVSERMAQYRLDVTGVVRQNQAAMKKTLQDLSIQVRL
ncbi:MAG: ImmA/IrrE family metallo-endopeptidase [Dehalococcoidia bacterium]|nr:ImmA/IrrE family metallo-endopeptidase [Dehalococcoidia bacterium]